GTQAIFYERPEVLTISLHQDRCYPVDSGGLEERGARAGFGANLNVPLPPGSGEGAYSEAMRRVVVPALERFGADLVIVASGFDASAYDPLGRMLLHSGSYRDLAQTMLDACGGRLVMVHEGGYSEFYVPFCAIAVVEALVGAPPTVEDPYLDEARAMAGHALTDEQRRIIDAAAGLLDEVPSRSPAPADRPRDGSTAPGSRDLRGDAPA
ncbi:MAG TPA: hypothetical protein VMD79_11345, partial [Solirubrobacteraceae bacterium]|nr:hypothetical protein [Solirubrobacteraceae bacterium]